MKCMVRLYNKFSNSLPVVGGGYGAYTQVDHILHYFPTAEAIVSTIIITAIGALVGYLMKLILDKIFKCKIEK